MVSPEGYLGKLPTCVLHADKRRNPKGPLIPFPVMPVHSRTCPSYPQLTFVYDNSFCGETEGDMVHLQGGENCVLLPFAHTQWLQKCSYRCGRCLLPQHFVLSTEEQSCKTAVALCQGSGKQKFPSLLSTVSPACLAFSWHQLSLL